MEDPLRKHLVKLKMIKESAHRRAEMYSDLNKLGDKHAMRSLGALNKPHHQVKNSKKFVS